MYFGIRFEMTEQSPFKKYFFSLHFVLPQISPFKANLIIFFDSTFSIIITTILEKNYCFGMYLKIFSKINMFYLYCIYTIFIIYLHYVLCYVFCLCFCYYLNCVSFHIRPLGLNKGYVFLKIKKF